MTAVARMTMLDLRSLAPYRTQGLVLFGLLVLMGARNPVVLVPALVVLVTPQIASYPFNIADKAGLETLYAVLPLPRRSVLYGHYAWAITSFLGTVTVGTALSLLLARIQAIPLDGHTLGLVLALSWTAFSVTVAIQFSLLIRFGYSQTSVLATTLPMALIGVAVVRLHLTIPSIQTWLPLLCVAGAAAIAASIAVAPTADQRRTRAGSR